MRELFAVHFAALLFSLGCSSDRASESKPTATPPTPVAVEVVSPPSPSSKEKVLTVESASALVSKWLDAQNRQSFGDYDALYAQRFYGVKRAGEVTTHFDRKGWLRDRRGMFAHPFRVTADGLSIRVVAETAIAEFEQSFQSQHYADKGPKQLVMILEDGALKIAREELFRSARAPDPRLDLSSADFSFIREIDGRRFLVVAGVGTEGQVIASPPERVGAAAAFGKLSDKSKLPAQLQSLIGATVAVEPGMQSQCLADLTSWGILAEIEPHFSTSRRWGGLDGEIVTDEQVAREVFGADLVSGRDHHFAADVTVATKGCTSARWGRLQSLGDVEHFEVEELTDPDSVLMSSLQRSLRKTKGYKDLERNFREAEGDGSFDELMAESLTLYRARLGAKSYLLTTFIHLGDCHGFSGELTQVWRIRGQTIAEMQSELPQAIRPIFAVDFNKDGIPEWVTDSQLIIWDGHDYSVAVDVTPYDYDCPC